MKICSTVLSNLHFFLICSDCRWCVLPVLDSILRQHSFNNFQTRSCSLSLRRFCDMPCLLQLRIESAHLWMAESRVQNHLQEIGQKFSLPHSNQVPLKLSCN